MKTISTYFLAVSFSCFIGSVLNAQSNNTFNFDLNDYTKKETSKSFVSESTYRYIPEQSPEYKKSTEKEVKTITTQKNTYTTVKADANASKEQIVSADLLCLFGHPGAFTNDQRFACMLDIELFFANDMLTAEFENKVILTMANKLVLSSEKPADINSSWAAIALAVLSNYYPPENYVPSTSPYASTAENYPSWRSKAVKSTIISYFKKCLTSDDCPYETKQGLARGWGYMGSSAVSDINKVLAVLNEKVQYDEVQEDTWVNQGFSWFFQAATAGGWQPGAVFDRASKDGEIANSLFQTLGYIYSTQGDAMAKDTLLTYMRQSAINDNYASSGNYSFTLGIYATLAAHYYGIKEAESYMESIALWHNNAVMGAGAGAIPFEYCQEAWKLIPAYIKKAKNLPEPAIGTAEYNIKGVINGLNLAEDFIIGAILFDGVGGVVISALYGTEAGAASSFIAADIGYMLAGTENVASYEFTLMVEQRLLAEAFSKTVAGKVTNVIMKPIFKTIEKFGGSISKVKSLIFKAKVKYNPTVAQEIEEVAFGNGNTAISKFGGTDPFPTTSMETVVPNNSSANLTTHTINMPVASTTSELPANTITWNEAKTLFANNIKNTPVEVNSISNIIGDITSNPQQIKAFTDLLTPAAHSVIPTAVTTMSNSQILTTVSAVKIATSAIAGNYVDGIQITSSVNTDTGIISFNRYYYNNGQDVISYKNIKYDGGDPVPVTEGDGNDIEDAFDNYNKFCLQAA